MEPQSQAPWRRHSRIPELADSKRSENHFQFLHGGMKSGKMCEHGGGNLVSFGKPVLLSGAGSLQDHKLC